MRRVLAALPLVLAGCATADTALLAGPATQQFSVVDRGWHTEICVAAATDAADPLAPFAAGFPGATELCFGFGERQWLVTHERGVAEMLSALLPSRAALLLTALRAPPVEAFGAADTVTLHVPPASAAALRRFIRRSTRFDAAGRPVRLAAGPYPGSVFFAATGTYDALSTCNTWSAAALRHAGVPVGGPVVFAGQVMAQVRRIAAAWGD